ncbi:peptidoglycan DD-metalloendopeptidase family protein [Maritimibacter sp. DP4N28-5]|uniref:Peptidoglycan DD-metalloendopeptidase family protein n=2 Tax=Maritimibacter dapengensis TaxID=2836868 RepID=A0ABS6T2A2_9RHOB|nr:peptidoglycan DD-metalloendopeptidase family protein [Maritimibacter dapengensis]
MSRLLLASAGLAALGACSETADWGSDFDFDLRSFGNGFSTADAARSVSGPRPQSDAKGIISYPDYQVAEARKGDTLTTLASRVGLPEGEIARFNGLERGAQLREGEIVALPRRVEARNVDVTTLAGNALDRIGPGQQSGGNAAPVSAETPNRHQVSKGETAYSIARLYGVSVRALAEWNSLDSALTVREGQFLLIPTAAQRVAEADPVSTNSSPGVGSPTPLPPSSSAPLPGAPAESANAARANTPSSPNLGESRTSASGAAMTMPADGRIVGAYVKGKSDGIDIGAPAGSAVKAAQAGTVAAITRDTDDVPILVLRHEGNLLTVYAGIDSISVNKGDSVGRGQAIAKVRNSDNPALHFQVRKGTASVDPVPYLN